LCTYKIKYKRTALYLGDISAFPDEEEVLILPFSAFEVKGIERNDSLTNNYQVTIELEECDQETLTNEEEAQYLHEPNSACCLM
jgi:hypothetical protein